MKILAKQIKEASECFRYYYYSKKYKPIFKGNFEVKVLSEVFKKSYAQALETSFKPNWRTILGWVDKRVFENVDINNDESFKQAKSTSEHILVFLRRWYNEMLLPENLLGYPNITLEYQLGNNLISSTIPILKTGDPLTILNIDNVVYRDLQLYNNIEVRTQAWLISKHLNFNDISYHNLSIGPQGGYNQNLIHLSKNDHDRTEQVISQIAKMLEKKINFPSYGDKCNMCPFRRRCRI